jgi:hypothetical protein
MLRLSRDFGKRENIIAAVHRDAAALPANVIASEAKQSRAAKKGWIASSLRSSQ